MFDIAWCDKCHLSVFCLLYFKISSLVYNTSARHERHECDTWNTSAIQVRRECNANDTSATRMTRVPHEWKILILLTTRVKTYFHTPVFTIWQVKDYKERNNFIRKTTFWKCLVSMPKCVLIAHHKNWFF